jgi:hypothetical protein
VPAYAGLNLEHIFDGAAPFDREVFFEPRIAPMQLSRLDTSSVQLHQAPTPTFELESWTRFQLKPPHYLDMSFECRPHQHVFDPVTLGYSGRAILRSIMNSDSVESESSQLENFSVRRAEIHLGSLDTSRWLP